MPWAALVEDGRLVDIIDIGPRELFYEPAKLTPHQDIVSAHRTCPRF